MKRNNWLVELTKHINSQLGQPFTWGVCDCTTFALECVEVMIGRGLVKPEFTYRTQDEALAFAELHRVEDALVEQCNAYRVPPHTAKAGDLLIVPEYGFECTHVCVGRRAVVPIPNHGVRAMPVEPILTNPDCYVLRID